MDDNTFILICMIFGAFSWWIAIQINENRLSAKEDRQKEIERLEQIKRVKQLTNKL